MLGFKDADRGIFKYSKGELNEDGTFKFIFADPAAIERQLDFCLPNRNAMIDQHLAAEAAKIAKARDVIAYEKDPAAFMRMLVIRDHGYQEYLPNPDGLGDALPNPESPEAFAARMEIPSPVEFSPEEIAVIKMGAVAHQNLCLGIRGAFDLMPFNETTGAGCTDRMAISVMNDYQDWLEKKDGNTPNTPTSSPPSQAA